MDRIAPVIEIIETNAPNEDGPLVPNDVRINGQSLLCADEPVIVGEISTEGLDLVRVTVTFLARRVSIHAELKPEPVKTLEDIKAERAERHAKLRK